MILDGLHEKEIFTENYPFRLCVNTVENFEYPFHWHKAVELVYILENDYRVDVKGKEYHLHERDILLIAGGDIHGITTRNNKGKRFFIQFDISMLDGFGAMHAVLPFLSHTRKFSSSEDEALHDALEKQILALSQAYEDKDFAYELYLNARIFDLLVLLSRSLAGKVSGEGIGGGINKTLGLEKLNQAFKYIEDNYQEDITLPDAARSAGFSQYHFSRIFKEITQKNFHSYLSEFRIKKAEKLLNDTNMTIAQAAHTAGFNSITTFNRIFRELRGCTPKEYKKMCI